MLQQSEADVVFAINKEGSYFGELEFAISSDQQEVARKFAVKALTDVEVMVLEKNDLYKIDLEFKNEIFSLFSSGKDKLAKLKSYALKARQWRKGGVSNDFSISSEPPLSSFSSHESDYFEERSHQDKSEDEISFELKTLNPQKKRKKISQKVVRKRSAKGKKFSEVAHKAEKKGRHSVKEDLAIFKKFQRRNTLGSFFQSESGESPNGKQAGEFRGS